MSLESVFRARVRELVNKPAANLLRREPTWADVAIEFPTGPDLAAALGYGSAAEERERGRWRKRRNVLDNYSRWKRGVRNAFRNERQNQQLSDEIKRRWKLNATPGSERDVLVWMTRYGATVLHVEGKFHYDPKRRRNISTLVYIWPEVFLEAEFSAAVAASPPFDWDWLSRGFINAWMSAYGLDENFQTEVAGEEDEEGEAPELAGAVIEALDFDIGRGDGVVWDLRG